MLFIVSSLTSRSSSVCMTSTLLSAPFICPQHPESHCKTGRREEQLRALGQRTYHASYCLFVPHVLFRDDHIIMQRIWIPKYLQLIICYGNEDMRETCIMETKEYLESLFYFRFLTQELFRQRCSLGNYRGI